ncbi:hypothetical protein [Flavobacterium sp. N1994]|uniref:hypothetical protein n=1 Tax=Flavobacterium sp. N1994 TaxID=2986827 RepID=UPI0022222974|nr:hypothetical protein [Flavobacterium sp. N1994]
MIYLLLFIIVLLSLVIVYLLIQFSQSNKLFKQQIGVLEAFLLQLSKEQKEQSLKVQLNNDLKIKMKEVNATLNKEIFDLNYQLFQEIHSSK